MTDDGTSLLSWLHPEPDPASLIPIDDDDDVSIHSGQAKAGEFYSNANAFLPLKRTSTRKCPMRNIMTLKVVLRNSSTFSLNSHILQTLMSDLIHHSI